MKSLIKIFILILLFITFSYSFAENEGIYIERRAAVDVGSGSTKVTIADVDAECENIISIIYEDSFPVPYQAALESSYDGRFDDTIQDVGMKTFRHIKDVMENHEVEKVAAVATAAFRQAGNGQSFANEVQKETSIPLKIIPQKEEGTLAFFSGIAATEIAPANLLSWDIGTGSFQMTALNQPEDLTVFMGGVGSIPFRNYIIDVVQEKDSDEVNTPNPMTSEDVKDADSYARSLGRKAYPVIKDKIKQPETTIVGIGRLFSSSVGPIGNGEIVDRNDLRDYINAAIGLTDEELDNPYAHVDVSNAILVLAFMKALHIQEIHIVDTKSTRGMLIYPDYWK